MAPRTQVLSIRLDEDSLQAVDLLVEAGLAQSRSEAASQFVSLGIQSAGELLERAEAVAKNVRSLRNDLFAAVKRKDVHKVKRLLEQEDRLIYAKDDDGVTPVLTSVYFGSTEVTQLLVDQGARLNLYEAAAVGDVNAVKENLEKDPEALNVHSTDGWTALHLASFFGHQKVVRFLLDQGAEVNVLSRNAMKNLPLHAALAGQRTEIAKMLIDANSDISVQDSAGWSPLHHAAAHGAIEIVDILLQRGANPKLKNHSGETPLVLAEKRGHKSLVKRLN